MSVNRIILLGNVGKTPEVRAVGDTKVAQFNLATTERFKGKDGNMREETEWHSISVWGKLADVIERYVDKGTQLYVEGKIKTEKYAAKDGTEKFITRIMANSIQLLGGKKENAEQQRFDPHAAHTTPIVDDLPEGDDGLPF